MTNYELNIFREQTVSIEDLFNLWATCYYHRDVLSLRFLEYRIIIEIKYIIKQYIIEGFERTYKGKKYTPN